MKYDIKLMLSNASVYSSTRRLAGLSKNPKAGTSPSTPKDAGIKYSSSEKAVESQNSKAAAYRSASSGSSGMGRRTTT